MRWSSGWAGGDAAPTAATAIPLLVVAAGYDPIALTCGLAEAGVGVAVLVRIRSDRVFSTDPPRRAPGPLAGPARTAGGSPCRSRRAGQHQTTSSPSATPVDDLEQAGRAAVCLGAGTYRPHPPPSAHPKERCGIDLGIGTQWAVIAHDDGTVERVAHPAPWQAVQQERRRVARQRSRRIVGSRAFRQANAKLARLDRRATNLRSNQPHTLTTTLARRYGTIVVEDLDVAAMGRGMGRRAFRRSVYQAGIGKIRPLLAYKCPAAGGCWWWLTAGLPPPRSTMAAAATGPTSPSTSGPGCVLGVGGGWIVTPTRR